MFVNEDNGDRSTKIIKNDYGMYGMVKSLNILSNEIQQKNK
jgi:hypothetical protein